MIEKENEEKIEEKKKDLTELKIKVNPAVEKINTEDKNEIIIENDKFINEENRNFIDEDEDFEKELIETKEDYDKIEEIMKYLEFQENEKQKIIKLLSFVNKVKNESEERSIAMKIWKDYQRINNTYNEIKLSNNLKKKFNQNIKKGNEKNERKNLFEALTIDYSDEETLSTIVILTFLKKIKADKKKVYERMKRILIEETEKEIEICEIDAFQLTEEDDDIIKGYECYYKTSDEDENDDSDYLDF